MAHHQKLLARLASSMVMLSTLFLLAFAVIWPVTARTITLSPTADALVNASFANNNYGTQPILRVDAPDWRSYVRFQVQNLDGAVTSARLRLFAIDTSDSGATLYIVPDNAWSETGITFNNAPTLGDVITGTGAVVVNSWIEIDVTSAIDGEGEFSFALVGNSTNRLRFRSRESTEAPQLIIETDTAVPLTSTPTALPQTPTTTPSPTVTPANPPSPTAPPPLTQTIIIDHHAVTLFEQIPETYLQGAEQINMLFIDRSVGSNINEGLTCLSYPSDEAAPNHCRRYVHVDPTFSVSPAQVNWYRPGGYGRDNWDFRFWEGDCSAWEDKINCFFNMINPVIDQYDVVSFQYSYLAVEQGSTIANLPGGFFWDNPGRLDVYDLEAYEAQHPDKTFIYWTTSLARSIGTVESEVFNEQMRQYAQANHKPLFDVADILAHDADGNPCYDNRDGVLYSNGNLSENYPDDGQAFLAICQHYTTEVDGGHLGSVSAGKIRVAKAFWVLMARLAGWDGNP